MRSCLLMIASLGFWGLAGCTAEGNPPPPPTSRVNAVPASQARAPTMPVDEFCDARHAGDEAPSLAFPPTTTPAAVPPGTPAWINVWATWCVPCVDEMPLLKKWHRRISGKGPVELVFLSVDDDDEIVSKFIANHPEMPDQLKKSPRVTDMEAFKTWLSGFGVDPNSSIPLNVFVDGAGKVRCARMGALKSHHYDVVEELLSGKTG